jgi:hypothetical protein
MRNFLHLLFSVVACLVVVIASTSARANPSTWLHCDVLNQSSTRVATLTVIQNTASDFVFCLGQSSENCTEFFTQLNPRDVVELRNAIDTWGSNGSWHSHRWDARSNSSAHISVDFELVRVSGGRWHFYGNISTDGNDQRLWCY